MVVYGGLNVPIARFVACLKEVEYVCAERKPAAIKTVVVGPVLSRKQKSR